MSRVNATWLVALVWTVAVVVAVANDAPSTVVAIVVAVGVTAVVRTIGVRS